MRRKFDDYKILVVGSQSFSSGKTILCKALIYNFIEVGLSFIPYKPHSGISYWKDFDIIQTNLRNKTLLCRDIIRLDEAARSGLPLEILNPVNRISYPIPYFKKVEQEQILQEFIAERFTHHDGVAYSSICYFNGKVSLNESRDMNRFYSTLKTTSDKLYLINSLQELVDAYVNNFTTATVSCYEYIKDSPVIIESFNDAAYPFAKAEECDVVLCVSNDIIFLFERDRYFSAIEGYSGRKSKLQLTLSDIFKQSLVKKTFHIQPLTKQEQNDPTKLKENYSEIAQFLHTSFK